MTRRLHPALQPAALFLAALGILVVFKVGGLDATTTALFYDPVAHVFPLRDDWTLAHLGHDDLKWTMLGFWLVCLCWKPLRRGALYMAAAVLAVTLLKDTSPVSCPWDLVDYGGRTAAGHCLPAGHPVIGFSLFGLYFALRHENPRAAALALIAACAIGTAAGAVQVARGAHFASHVLWTAWVAWTVCATLDWLARWRA